MENDLPPHVLSIKISCSSCEECPNILKKKLLKMSGVESFSLDTENNLVYVVGRINATTLVNKVAKLGKSVRFVSDDEQNHKRNDGSSSYFAAPKKRKPHKNCCCEDGRHSEKEVEQKEEHICEAYVPPVIDPRVCRDFHCKTHPRGRVIVDRVPAENTSSFFGMGGLQMGDLRYNPYAGGSYQHLGTQSGWYGQGPPQYGYAAGGSYHQHPGTYEQGPPQYGYGWQPQRSMNLPQHPYIFQ